MNCFSKFRAPFANIKRVIMHESSIFLITIIIVLVFFNIASVNDIEFQIQPIDYATFGPRGIVVVKILYFNTSIFV